MTKGYHLTPFYDEIMESGEIEIAPLSHENLGTIDSEGIWLFQEPQESESLLGMLFDKFAKTRRWEMVELEVDFEIKDCIRALHPDDILNLTHRGSAGDWVYHNKEPVFVVRKPIPKCQIQLRRTFDLGKVIQ